MEESKEFWCKVYLQALAYGNLNPEFISDKALAAFEDRFCTKINKNGTEATDEN
jgi:hypothetical protein